MKTSGYMGTAILGFFNDISRSRGRHARASYINADVGGDDEAVLKGRIRSGISFQGYPIISRNALEADIVSNRRNEWLTIGPNPYGLVHTRGGADTEEVKNKKLERWGRTRDSGIDFREQQIKLQMQELYGQGALSERRMVRSSHQPEKPSADGHRGAYFGINFSKGDKSQLVGPSLIVLSGDNNWTGIMQDYPVEVDVEPKPKHNWNKNVYTGTYDQWRYLKTRALEWMRAQPDFANTVFYKTGKRTYWRGILASRSGTKGINTYYGELQNGATMRRMSPRMDCVHGMIRSIGLNTRGSISKANIDQIRHYEVSCTHGTTKSGSCIACAIYMWCTGHDFSHLHLGASENWSLPWERRAMPHGPVRIVSPNTFLDHEKYGDLRSWNKTIKRYFAQGLRILGDHHALFQAKLDRKVAADVFDLELLDPTDIASKPEFEHGQMMLQGLSLGVKVRDILNTLIDVISER